MPAIEEGYLEPQLLPAMYGGPLDGQIVPPETPALVTVRTCVDGHENFHRYVREGSRYRFAGTAIKPHSGAARLDSTERIAKAGGIQFTALCLESVP